jgi:hypothetical protein
MVKSTEDIVKKAEVRLHVLLNALDSWNRRVYTGFLRYTQDRDIDSFMEGIRRQMEYIQAPRELESKVYAINRNTPIEEVALILNEVRKWLISEMDNLLVSVCEQCSSIVTVPKEEIKKVEEIPMEKKEEIPKEEELAPEEREVIVKKEKELPAKEVKELPTVEEEEKTPVALPSITWSRYEDIWDTLQSKVGKELQKALKIECIQTPSIDECMNRVKEILYKFRDRAGEPVDSVFPELNKDPEQGIRFLKGLVIVADRRIIGFEDLVEENKLVFHVLGHGDTQYDVEITKTYPPKETCTCEDFQIRHKRCKHIYASIISIYAIDWKETGAEEKEVEE